MKKFLIFAVVVIAAAGIYFGITNKDKIAEIADNLGASPEASPADDGTSTESDSIFAEPVTYSALKQEYTSITQNFSFKYSDGFKVSSAPVAGGGEVTTVENTKGSGFQVFSIAWDESDPITPERIWQDMPDADVLEPKNAKLDGEEALVFYGYDEDMGETFEVWAVYKGKLYQISGPKMAEKLVTETLETWDWK